MPLPKEATDNIVNNITGFWLDVIFWLIYSLISSPFVAFTLLPFLRIDEVGLNAYLITLIGGSLISGALLLKIILPYFSRKTTLK